MIRLQKYGLWRRLICIKRSHFGIKKKAFAEALIDLGFCFRNKKSLQEKNLIEGVS